MRRIVMHRYNRDIAGDLKLEPVYGTGPWWAHLALTIGGYVMLTGTRLRWWAEQRLNS